MSKTICSTPEEILWTLTEHETFIQLKEMFKNVKGVDGLDKTTFLEIITKLIDNEPQETSYDALILELFNKIDNQSKNRITWDMFLDFNLKALQPNNDITLQLGDITYMQPKELKRDSIVKIVLLETKLYFTYAFVTKYGQISLFDAALQHLTSYQAIMSREDLHRNAKESRMRYRWLTDAVFMADINMFIIVNSTRSMTIYDASGLKHVPLWHISGFPNIIQVLSYCESDNKNKTKKSLILGLDNGKLATITFFKPKDELLPKKHQDKMSFYYFLELVEFKEYLQYKSLGKYHTNSVVSMQLLQEWKSIITCSKDDKNSVVILNIDYCTVTHRISTKRGIKCFVASSNKKLFITGSDDGVLCIWPLHKKLPNLNTKVKNKTKIKSLTPLDTITANTTGIVDIIILEVLEMFMCCSRDAELKCYNLNTYKNLINIKLNFECFDIFKIRTPEWGVKCIFPGAKRSGMSDTLTHFERNYLLLTCCNAYAKIDLFYMDGVERHLHGEFLPAQPLQNSVLIPQDWECNDVISNVLDHKMTKLDNDLWKELINLDLKTKKSDVHLKIALLEERKAKMKWAVEHGAPFLALPLYDVQEIKLPQKLPTVENKKTQNIVDKTHKLLSNAVSQTIVFSDISSSRTSRSSSKCSKNSTHFNNSLSNTNSTVHLSSTSSRSSLI